jgi:dihydrofolate synthase / folylpolyglutamate synthase
MGSMEGDPILWLYGLQQFGIKLGLDGIRALLHRLGHPESAYPAVLVGGTNGKGSVAAMMEAILSASGRKVGLYTSPHLVHPGERVRIAGHDLTDAELGRRLETVRAAIESALADGALAAHPSFFEVMTAAALLAFRETGADVAILEVGLGGRLDATNSVPAALSVIVTVDLDHTDRLGTTIAEIAAEKAGIVKSGRTLVTGVGAGDALPVLRRAALEAGSPMIVVPDVTRVEPESLGGFSVLTPGARYDGLSLPLPGRHQIENACVAIVAIEELGRALDDLPPKDAVRRGLRAVSWPGRLQWIEGDPPILLDGAHNPAGSAALAEYVRDRGGEAPVLLFGAMANKDARGILAPLAPLVRAAVVTRPPVERAADPGDVARAAAELQLPVETVADPASALARARELAPRGSFVLVAGSLYLVGAILGILRGSDAPGPVAM